MPRQHTGTITATTEGWQVQRMATQCSHVTPQHGSSTTNRKHNYVVDTKQIICAILMFNISFNDLGVVQQSLEVAAPQSGFMRTLVRQTVLL